MLKTSETLSLESRLRRSLLQCKAIQLDLEDSLEALQWLKQEREKDKQELIQLKTLLSTYEPKEPLRAD
jgi:hypothetical protein